MATQSIPLFGSYTNRNDNPLAFTSSDQVFKNCYPELVKNPLKKSGSVNLYKRPGFAAANNAAASYIGTEGSCIWTGFSTGPKALFCYLNGTDLRVYDSGGNIIGGTISNVTDRFRLTETTISGVAYLTLVGQKTTPDTRSHAWYMAEGAGAWTEITDVDFPSNTPAIDIVGMMVHKNGRAFIMDVRGTIWQSGINDLANWAASEFIAAQTSPDGGAGLAPVKNLIAAFGAYTIEFFQYGDNATGSALTRVDSQALRIGTQQYGLLGSETVKVVGDSVFFIGVAGDTNQMGVYRLIGTTLSKISTGAIDRMLAQLYTANNGVGAGIAGAMQMHGMQHIVLMVNNATNTPCYCIETGQWWILALGDSSVIQACVGIGGSSQFTVSTNGASQGRKLYVSAPGTVTFQDNGTTLTASVQTDNLDQGTQHRKFYKSFELVCDTQSTSGNISISWSDDDYATFSTARTIDPSTGTRRVTRLGSTNRNNNHKRAWKIEETVNRPFRGTELVLEYDVGEA